jgi:hypothetical protein
MIFVIIMAIYISVLLTISYVFVVHSKLQNKFFFWSSTFVYLIGCRFILDYSMDFQNPDEIEWQFKAKSLIDAPLEYCNYYIWGDLTRFFTILPLAIFNLITVSYEPNISHLLQTFFYFFIFYLLNEIFSLIKNNELISRRSVVFFIVFYALNYSEDLTAFNSEAPALFIYLCSVYLFISGVQNSKNHLVYISGFLLSITPLAKEQIIIISLCTGLIYLLYLLRDRREIALKMLLISLIFPVMIAVSSVVGGKSDYFTLMYSNILDYQKGSLDASNMSMTHRILMIVGRSFKFYSVFYYLGALTIVYCLLFRKKVLMARSEIVVFISLFALTIYTTAAPGNSFYHYLHIHLLFLFWVVYYSQSVLFTIRIKNLFIYCTILFSTVFLYRLSVNEKSNFLKKFDAISIEIEHKVNKIINQSIYEGPNENGLVWGWNTKLYLDLNLKRSSFYMYPVFTQSNYSARIKSLSLYAADIARYQPRIIICNVGANAFYFTNREDCLCNKQHPLHKFIMNKYILVDSGDSYEILLSKSQYRKEEF